VLHVAHRCHRVSDSTRFDKLALYGFIFPPVFPPYASRVCHSAHGSRAIEARWSFLQNSIPTARSLSLLDNAHLYPAEVPTNVSLRSECSRCLLSKTERWLTIFLDWYVFEPNVKSNLTLALSFFSLSLLLHSFLVVTITSKVRITRYHNG